MARIVFDVDIASGADRVLRALDTKSGLEGWWTDDVEFAGGVGSDMKLGFPIAPLPFELHVDAADANRIVWSSVGKFPPHWVNTKVIWTLKPSETGSGTTVHFSHEGWASDEGPFGMAALTWGRLMDTLKRHVEAGEVVPLFRKDLKS